MFDFTLQFACAFDIQLLVLVEYAQHARHGGFDVLAVEALFYHPGHDPSHFAAALAWIQWIGLGGFWLEFEVAFFDFDGVKGHLLIWFSKIGLLSDFLDEWFVHAFAFVVQKVVTLGDVVYFGLNHDLFRAPVRREVVAPRAVEILWGGVVALLQRRAYQRSVLFWVLRSLHTALQIRAASFCVFWSCSQIWRWICISYVLSVWWHLLVQCGNQRTLSIIDRIISWNLLLVEGDITKFVHGVLWLNGISELVYLCWHWLIKFLPQAWLPVSWLHRWNQFINNITEELFVIGVALCPLEYRNVLLRLLSVWAGICWVFGPVQFITDLRTLWDVLSPCSLVWIVILLRVQSCCSFLFSSWVSISTISCCWRWALRSTIWLWSCVSNCLLWFRPLQDISTIWFKLGVKQPYGLTIQFRLVSLLNVFWGYHPHAQVW